eukprot:1231373-Pleurochrysis_carterae.AAC.2
MAYPLYSRYTTRQAASRTRSVMHVGRRGGVVGAVALAGVGESWQVVCSMERVGMPMGIIRSGSNCIDGMNPKVAFGTWQVPLRPPGYALQGSYDRSGRRLQSNQRAQPVGGRCVSACVGTLPKACAHEAYTRLPRSLA